MKYERKSVLCLVLILFLYPLLLAAQDPPTSAAPAATLEKAAPVSNFPSDPVALLAVAREKNGLTSADVRPWHIRATYTTFDIKGKPEDHGVYEEWWLSPAKYRRTYASSKFTQSEYATATGLYREGSQDWPSGEEVLLRSALIDPVLETTLVQEFTPQSFEVTSGAAKLNCVRLFYAVPANLTVANDFFLLTA